MRFRLAENRVDSVTRESCPDPSVEDPNSRMRGFRSLAQQEIELCVVPAQDEPAPTRELKLQVRIGNSTP